MAELERKESWAHGLWRKWTARDPLRLTATDRVEPVIEEFRGRVRKHGLSQRVFDPTRFELGDLLEVIQKSPLEPAEQPSPPDAPGPPR
jgi:hypothetical protein